MNVNIKIYGSNEVLYHQNIDLPDEGQNGLNPSSKTTLEIERISKNMELTGAIEVDSGLEETTNFELDCSQDEGDAISFRIHDEYIDSRSECASLS